MPAPLQERAYIPPKNVGTYAPPNSQQPCGPDAHGDRLAERRPVHAIPPRGLEKDVKIVGTNSINFFRISESLKKRTENEFETNSKLRRKQYNRDAKPSVADTYRCLLPNAHGDRLAERRLVHAIPPRGLEKDVKIVGTNSINFFRISESFKKRTENELKTNSKLRRKQCNRSQLYANGTIPPRDTRTARSAVSRCRAGAHARQTRCSLAPEFAPRAASKSPP